MTNAWDGTPISTFAYANDAAGRRVGRIDSGVTTNVFGYNVRSEVTDAMMGTNQFGYEYDPIGNRVAATNNTQALSYVANELNQYTSISNGVPVEPVYDDDGNMVEYGDWAFTWNAENRLIGATNAVHGVGYEYDFMGRMARKVSGGAATEFVWDEFNIIAEIEDSEVRYNVWGLDLSQTPQGAGGVGGLLAVVHGDSDFYTTCYDANGNITEYLDTDGTIVARRDYGPFGETLALTGTLSSIFTHWWSTKPWDPATGFSEYEFRMYSPELGRWVSRDPMGEMGGPGGLLAFVGNRAVGLVDILGLYGCCDGKPFNEDIQCCENKRIVNKTTDDAGRTCCQGDIRTAYIKVRASGTKNWIDTGHAWPSIPGREDRGFYPKRRWLAYKGELRGEATSDPTHERAYRACPESIDKLISNSTLKPLEWWKSDSYNCVHYAQQVFGDAGFDVTPSRPNRPDQLIGGGGYTPIP